MPRRRGLFRGARRAVARTEAVAQVVMNRVFSGVYPDNVCGVVYQNANRHLACQFTFACEGKDLSRIDEPDMWEQAKRIAKDTLDGKIWLAEVGHATHYHAYWVHPSWVHEMAKLYKLGVHTFYRPRAWGDGSDAPNWGPVKQPACRGQDPGSGRFAGCSPAKRTQNCEALRPAVFRRANFGLPICGSIGCALAVPPRSAHASARPGNEGRKHGGVQGDRHR